MNIIPPYVRALILDMGGVLWKADLPIGNLSEIFACINARKLRVAFATNNGTRTPHQNVKLMCRFGLKVEAWQVVTSSLVLAHLLSQDFPNGGYVFAIGEEGLIRALQEKGFVTLSAKKAGKAQAVAIGLDRLINFEKISEATLLVRRGVPFYATNPDKTFSTPRGDIPGVGSWISVIVTATGINPKYAGKPSPAIIELACQRLGIAKEEILVVGDRLYTDIAAGQAAGCPVALVLSGVSSRDEAEAWKPSVNIIANDLQTLITGH